MRRSPTRSWRAFDPAASGRSTVPAEQARPPSAAGSRVRILGLDPGSRHTGYGIVDCNGADASYVACGAISTVQKDFPGRLQEIFEGVRDLVEQHRPTEIAIERVFVNRNVDSALKLGQARGAALCGVFASAAEVFEYSPREVKMAVVGSGAADKLQVQHMVRALLKVEGKLGADAADALAVALCHVHGRGMRQLLAVST